MKKEEENSKSSGFEVSFFLFLCLDIFREKKLQLLSNF